MSSIPFFAIMAIPLTIVVIAKEMDLSFPSIMAMGMVAFNFTYGATAFINNATIQVFLAIVAALVTGAIIGWLNGYHHRQVRHSFTGRHHRYTIPMEWCGPGAYTRGKFFSGIY